MKEVSWSVRYPTSLEIINALVLDLIETGCISRHDHPNETGELQQHQMASRYGLFQDALSHSCE